jgi:protein TonB
MASRWRNALGNLLVRLASLALAVLLTGMVFLLLPILQRVSESAGRKGAVFVSQAVTTEAPPVLDEVEPEEEPPPKEEPPEMKEEAEPLALDALDAALNVGIGAGGAGDVAINLGSLARKEAGEEEDMFSLEDLDQKPRIVHQPAPEIPAALKRLKTKATVHVIFVVDEQGRVTQPSVQKSTHPALEAPALQAVSKWRFEPGKRKGTPVKFKMRVPITVSTQ